MKTKQNKIRVWEYKATASVGGWFGYGYGDTPGEAASNLASGIPSHLLRRCVDRPSVRKVQRFANSHAYPFEAEDPQGRAIVVAAISAETKERGEA